MRWVQTDALEATISGRLSGAGVLRAYVMRVSKVIVFALIVGHAALAAGAQTWSVSPTSQGVVPLAGNSAAELSGLTWAGGSQFYAVSDNAGQLFPLTIQLDANSGTIVSTSVSPVIQLAAGTDLEGVAYNSANSNILVSDESGPAIREYSLADGSVVQTLGLPGIRGTSVEPQSRVALCSQIKARCGPRTRRPSQRMDRFPPSPKGRSYRLQKFDATFSPVGQWAMSPTRSVVTSAATDATSR
jgi:hypothetical protein